MRRTLHTLLASAALVAAPALAFAGESVRSAERAHKESVRAPSPEIVDSMKRHGFLSEVVGELERSRSAIARNTLEALRSGAIVVDTLDRLTVADCRQLVEENADQWSGVVASDECTEGESGRAQVPAKILEKVSGYQHENRIYIRQTPKVRDAAVTIVHETNHVANATHEHYASAREKLEEEYRAYYVALLFTDGRAPNAGYLHWLKGWIIEQYALAGVSAKDVSDVPPGILDNAMPVPGIETLVSSAR